MAIIFLIASCGHELNNPFDPEYHYIVTDIDGNVYHPVIIGKQVWLAENLRTTRYRNGDPIPNVTDSTFWTGLSTGAYCWYDNDVTYKNEWGALYNWYVVNDSRKITPIGWHVPTRAEWDTLVAFLGGQNIAGRALKDSLHWAAHLGGKNESGFTATASGSRFFDGKFYGLGINGNWWSSSNDAIIVEDSWFFNVNISSETGGYFQLQKDGFSIRCLHD